TTRSMSYTAPSPLLNPANWMPTGAATNPLEPYWGKVKCFAMATSAACTIPSSVPFSTVPGSGFHNMATEVYNTVKNLTTEQRNIALWWADDAGATSTPPGHWVSIIGQVVNTKNIGLGKASEAYALVTMSMADAFISCWDAKYQYNLLRPVSYIKQHIAGGNTWSTVLNTPPFPEYPSGHSVASGAAADVLTALFGNIAFTDQTGASLGYASRSYTSFHHAAQEAALSRLYGGIHYREAIDNGLVQGKEVAKAVFNKIKMK
ncbi:MAG: phosphatase family protein, partial [Segetibacter sp.]|nr:phosphatase family protein [Segetibacter sp.]